MEVSYIEKCKINDDLHLVVYKPKPSVVVALIRDKQDKIIGCGYLASFPENDVDFIHSVSVEPEFRNNGYCQMIINKLIKHSIRQAIQLDTENPIAKHAYEKCGFRVIKEGRWRSGCWLMQYGDC